MQTVEIMVHDDGRVMVGSPPAAEAGEGSDMMSQMSPMTADPDGMAGKEYMQPAKNVDEALQIARQLLTSNPEVEKSEEQDFLGGYKEAGGMQEEGAPY